jgi:hypothetical protein
VAIELAGGLVGLYLADAGDSHVVRVGESHGGSHEPHRSTLALVLESRELRPSLVEVGEGLGESLGRVVVGARTVLGPPRGHLVAVAGPKIEQSEVVGVFIVVVGDLDAGLFLGAILVPVLLHQPEHRVVREP